MKQYFIVFAALLLLRASTAAPGEDQKRGPKITSHVFFDIEIDGEPAGIAEISWDGISKGIASIA